MNKASVFYMSVPYWQAQNHFSQVSIWMKNIHSDQFVLRIAK